MFNKSMWKRLKDQSGMALPMALILLVVASFIVVPGLWATGSMIKVNQALELDTMAYYAAKSGIEDVMWRFKNGPPSPFTSSPPSSYTPYLIPGNPINGMTVKVTSVNVNDTLPSSTIYTIKSEAIDSSGKTLSTIYVEIWDSTGSTGSSPFVYAIVALDGPITLSGPGTITSSPGWPDGQTDIYANGNIFNDRIIHGDVSATGSITGSGSIIPGPADPNTTDVQTFIPIDMTTYWDQANAGPSQYYINQSYNNSRTMSSGRIRGNLSVGGSGTTTISDDSVVWVDNFIDMRGSHTITGDNYTIIAGQYFSRGGNATVWGYPVIISNTGDMTLTGGGSGYSRIGTLYAPNGTIAIGGSNDIYGSLIGRSVTMSGNSNLVYPYSSTLPITPGGSGTGTFLTKFSSQ